MTEFLLIRHATNDWVKTGRLAGWTPGVHLNQDGHAQAEALGDRLAVVTLNAIYTSPLERATETAQAIARRHAHLKIQTLDAMGEVRYGDWQGARLAKLRRQPLWQTVQVYPSRAHFPGGETIRQAQARAVDAIEALVKQHPKDRVAIVSHSDIIKLVITYYLGMPLDLFQRIEISPASITVVRLVADRPAIACVNDTSHLPASQRPSSPPGQWQRLRRRLRPDR